MQFTISVGVIAPLHERVVLESLDHDFKLLDVLNLIVGQELSSIVTENLATDLELF